jgi:hypothetical protein
MLADPFEWHVATFSAVVVALLIMLEHANEEPNKDSLAF